MGNFGQIDLKERSDIKITAGSVNDLLNINYVSIIYDYPNMMVGEMTEEDYLKKKMEEYEKKEAGKGEKFKQNWIAARSKYFEPKFEELFNVTGEKIHLAGKNNTDNYPVTLKISTVYTEPGFNVGVVRKPAYINVECSFVGIDDVKLLHYSIKNAQGSRGMKVDYDPLLRIAESYAKAAKMLVTDLTKKLKKAAKKKK